MASDTDRSAFREQMKMEILDAIQDDYESLPIIVRSINGYAPEEDRGNLWPNEVTVDDVIPAMEELMGSGMVETWLDDGTGGMVKINPAQVVTLRDHPNTHYSTWPIPGSIWFKPTDKGQEAYKKWRSAIDAADEAR